MIEGSEGGLQFKEKATAETKVVDLDTVRSNKEIDTLLAQHRADYAGMANWGKFDHEREDFIKYLSDVAENDENADARTAAKKFLIEMRGNNEN